jgi:hypothetical protein
MFVKKEATTTAKAVPDEPKTWKEDYQYLRRLIKQELKKGLCGDRATFLYTLLSHMRGRMHMKTYKLYLGGWRMQCPTLTAPTKEERPKFNRMFSGTSEHILNHIYSRAAIVSLEDQAAFLEARRVWLNDNVIRSIAKRAVSNDYKEEVKPV